MKRAVIITAIIIFIIGIIGIIGVALDQQKEEEVPNLSGKGIIEAENQLREVGFHNFVEEADESSDAKTILDSSNWMVVSQNPAPGTMSKLSDEITMYCIKKEQFMQDQVNAIKNKSLTDAITTLDSLGYKPHYIHAGSKIDFDSEIPLILDSGATNWVVVNVDNINTDDKTVNVYINTTDNIDSQKEKEAVESTLEAKLPASTAMVAVENYGNEMYPYGFKLHWITGTLAEDAVDENTWFFKVKCDVTNEYGTKAKDLTCEAYVTGTASSPTVTEFSVY